MTTTTGLELLSTVVHGIDTKCMKSVHRIHLSGSNRSHDASMSVSSGTCEEPLHYLSIAMVLLPAVRNVDSRREDADH